MPLSDSTQPLLSEDQRLTSTWLIQYIRINQYLIYWPFNIATAVLKRSSTVLIEPSDVVANYNYIVAANHQNRIDPFIMSGQLPDWTWKQLAPFRYFIFNRLFFTPILHWFFVSFGCFPTKVNDRTPHGIAFAEKILSLGQTPFIFPEGKRAIQGSPARPGIASLARLSNTRIIPIHIEWDRSGWLPRYRLTVGRPFDGSKMTPDEIMVLIYSLPL